MDVVLGVSMGSAAIRMVLVEGGNADGATVEEDNFPIAAHSAREQVVSAILGTRESATAGGYQLTSTGVVCIDAVEAASLRDMLGAYQMGNVMLVSAFLAAAALAQTVGNAIGYRHIAMLLVEPDSAVLGIVDSDDGSIAAIRRQRLLSAARSRDTVVQLAAMIMSCNALESRPQGVFIIGNGVDVGPLKPALETIVPMRVNAPEEPEMALARGAALASANAPLFVSSTAALAYAQDPGTGNVDLYLNVADAAAVGSDPVAYSGVVDPDDHADTIVIPPVVFDGRDDSGRRRPPLLVGSALALIFVSAVVALVVALAINIRTTVALQPSPNQNLIVPTEEVPTPEPAPTLQASPPIRQLVPPPAPSVPNAPSALVRAPAEAAVPAPAAEPAPAVPAPAVPAPAAPAPLVSAQLAPVPMAPVPVPIPIPVPAASPQLPALQLPLPGNQPLLQPPAPPVQLPKSPLQIPVPPVAAPAPKPPVELPTPNPPVQLPTPKPPVQLPTPKPPVQLPKPTPPVQLPAPKPPVQVPAPKPPVQLPTPKPPVQLPAPKPPTALPVPAAPPAPRMPTRAAPAPQATPRNPGPQHHSGS